jgi:hypothetical protein
VRIHPREKIVDSAERKLSECLREIRSSDLTDAEYISVVADAFGQALGRMAKYQIRYERHGDTDKPGGVE